MKQPQVETQPYMQHHCLGQYLERGRPQSESLSDCAERCDRRHECFTLTQQMRQQRMEEQQMPREICNWSDRRWLIIFRAWHSVITGCWTYDRPADVQQYREYLFLLPEQPQQNETLHQWMVPASAVGRV